MTTRKKILNVHKKQLSLEIDAIRLAIQHSGAKGSEAEFAFRQMLRKYLPKKYKLSSGFIINGSKVSKQHDIIIYDDLCNTPVFLGNNSGTFLGGTVYGVFEITITKLITAKLEKDIEKIAHLRRMFPEAKVAFQKVFSCPILNEEDLKLKIENCLSTGISIDDIWPKIKTDISDDGAFVGDINTLSLGVDTEEIKSKIAVSCKQSKKYVVKEKIVYSTPPPRTYLCALNGTKYKSLESLSKTVQRLTKKYAAHIHGLLVLNGKGGDWLLSTKAHRNYEVDAKTKDAFFKFLENMKQAFQGMLVGKYSAADLEQT